MSKHEKGAIAPSAPDAEGVRQETLHTLTTTCPPDRDFPDPASLSLEELETHPESPHGRGRANQPQRPKKNGTVA
jgi:hypothetical protein